MHTIERRPDPRGLRLRGVFTALSMPTGLDGSLDEAALRILVRRQLAADVAGLIVPVSGADHEGAASADDDRPLAVVVEMRDARTWRRRTAVVAGVSPRDTADAIRATRRAAALGADAVLLAAPVCDMADPWTLDAHFRAVADQGGLPIVVDNVPGLTGANVDADTFLRLAKHPHVAGIREASGDLDQVARVCRGRSTDVAVLAGDDTSAIAVLAMGGTGVVSVAANEVPADVVALCTAGLDGDWRGARRLHERWLPLFLSRPDLVESSVSRAWAP